MSACWSTAADGEVGEGGGDGPCDAGGTVEGAGLCGAAGAERRGGKWTVECSGRAGAGVGCAGGGRPATTELHGTPRWEATRYSGRGLAGLDSGGLSSGTQRERYCEQTKDVWPCLLQSLQWRCSGGV